MSQLGVLAYGSILVDPGGELREATQHTIKGVTTPFAVEYARSSSTRGFGPTLVPVDEGGLPVVGAVLVMNPETTLQEARDRLYRRETGEVGSDKTYVHLERPGLKRVHLPVLKDFMGVSRVIYTQLGANIEPGGRNADRLAELAIESVHKADHGDDGISYLMSMSKLGIATALSNGYEQEILRRTNATSLEGALTAIRGD